MSTFFVFGDVSSAVAEEAVSAKPTAETQPVKEAKLPSEPPKIVNTTVIADIDNTITVTLEGETLDSIQVHRTEKGGLYVNAIPIFTALGNEFEFDDTKKALIVRRSQDGVVMELYANSGVVAANGKPLGKLPHFGEISEDRLLLTSNAISILSGTNSKFDKDKKQFSFELDSRLRVASGFEVFVEGVSLGDLNPAPKSVGPVMLLPLLPIAKALGHEVEVIEGGDVVRVRRPQDSAVFTLNLTNGLVKLRDKPYGIAKDVTYIDPVNLLLPVEATEAVTGTHIKVDGGSNEITILLDERLKGAISPTESVDQAAKDTPFTLETLRFNAGPSTINSVDLDFRVQKFNGRLRYEIPDLPTAVAEVEPSWLSVDYAHLGGIEGSIGDYSADFRELDGVGLRRIRGVSGVKVTDNARIAVAAGVPSSGSRQISKDQSRQTFSGFTAGARYAHKEGWELGGAYKNDGLSDDQMAVLSAISGRLGTKKGAKVQWTASADVGAFSGVARQKSVDVKAQATARYEINPQIALDVNADYIGSEFLRTDLDAKERLENIVLAENPEADFESTESFVPDERIRDRDTLAVSSSVRYVARDDIGGFSRPAVSARVQHSRSGVITGASNGSHTNSMSISGSTGIKAIDVSLSGGVNRFSSMNKQTDVKHSGTQFDVQAYKSFNDRISVQGRFMSNSQTGRDTVQTGTINANMRPFNVPMQKNASLSIVPSAGLRWSSQNGTHATGGLFANFESGAMFGEKNQVGASFGLLQSVSSQEDNTRTDKFLSVSVARRLPIGKNMSLGLAYNNDLNGNQRIGLQLQGLYHFNEKRNYKKTRDGRGVLKGLVFYDKNRDGERQDDEPYIGGALVRVPEAKLALRADRGGSFTIQNMKEGIFEVQVDGRSLPLGYALSEDATKRVTIAEAMITHIDLPVVKRGQIRGFAFNDENGDGEHNTGETRIEGAKLGLKRKGQEGFEHTVYTTSFGQYAFDDLDVDMYEIHILENSNLGIKSSILATEIAEDSDGMMRKNIPVTISNKTEFVENTEGDPDPPPDRSAVQAQIVAEP